MNDRVYPLNDLIKRRIRPDVLSMQAYSVQPSHGLVKLDAMENPHRLPVGLQDELGRRLGAVALNRYPGDRINDLKHALADHAGLPADFDIMLGNGSDELISLLSLACAVAKDPANGTKPLVLAPVPGFVMYSMSAQLQGLRFHGVPLTADFELDTFSMLEAVSEFQPAIIYLAYPNNPTANLWDPLAMEHIIGAARELGSLVVIDEAYQPFASATYLDRIRQFPEEHSHVVLMRTLSKFGLAGVRIGYMLGHQELIAQIEKVRPPYNVSVLNCECALFALEHAAVFEEQATEIRRERDRLVENLSEFDSLTVWPSEANMILVRFDAEEDRARTVFDGLKERGILVKNVSKMHPLLSNCLRLTVGTVQENEMLLAAIKEFL